MREIKFRLRFGNKIVGYEKWDIDCDPHGRLGYWLSSENNKQWLSRYIPHKEKDQFIGLCDKKGKEGYHKDIWEWGKFPDIRCVVRWNKGIFYLQPINSGLDYPIQLLPEGNIVGNIFQNPELLEKK